MSDTELLSRITANRNTLGGKPAIRDIRISVELILSLMAQGADQSLALTSIRQCTAQPPRADKGRHLITSGIIPS